MIFKEDAPYFLRENETGAENGECGFRCRFREQAAEFFFAVTDTEIISPFKEDNEDIWQGDAVEVFLSSDGNLDRYYEMEVSPFGVRFWGEIEGRGEKRVLRKSPPPFEAETVRTAEGYAVHIRLPLAALKGFDRSAAKLNAFRLDRKADGTQKLYALSPTLSATFHKPEYFIQIWTKDC